MDGLCSLLRLRNGFFAFESALLVRPLDLESPPMGHVQWNKPDMWRSEYQVDLGDALFFAEDLFGVQFCIKEGLVNSFDPETGQFRPIANSIEEWCGWILQDSKVRTGWPLAHFWQLKNGPILSGMRLLPKIPFVLGGQFSVENLYQLRDVDGMRFRASIANQISDCPDGTKVVLKIKREQRSAQ